LRKLAKLGFGGTFLAWIKSYLTGREQFVKTSGSQSRVFSVRSGVPQGSHLGPLLFILFLNEVFSCFRSLRFLLYTDDLKILPATETLQKHRLNLMFFPIESGMQLNWGKCKSMSFRRSHFTKHFQYELSGHRLDSICNLGVVLDSKLI
jgi:hypothetical protein